MSLCVVVGLKFCGSRLFRGFCCEHLLCCLWSVGEGSGGSAGGRTGQKMFRCCLLDLDYFWRYVFFCYFEEGY